MHAHVESERRAIWKCLWFLNVVPTSHVGSGQCDLARRVSVGGVLRIALVSQHFGRGLGLLGWVMCEILCFAQQLVISGRCTAIDGAALQKARRRKERTSSVVSGAHLRPRLVFPTAEPGALPKRRTSSDNLHSALLDQRGCPAWHVRFSGGVSFCRAAVRQR